MFPSKAAHIRSLVADGHSIKYIAALVGCSRKYAYAVRSRDSDARTIRAELAQLGREIRVLRVEFSDLRQELRDALGLPSNIIERRLQEIR
jgi:hypothetical protein